ncbi:MAG: hypothetical protein DRI90_11890 [Deltaproteobacteria bacterium]|nr:MAG: hypothetical protein DRI90_11890 [Deltaproteobacteria bacterium]
MGGLTCSTWSELGSFGPLDLDSANYAYTPAITIDGAGNPVAAWHEMASGAYSIMVKQWSGSSWEQLGPGPVDVDPAGHSQSPALATDCSGHPVVAWGEDQEIFVKQWDGSAWQQLGTASLRVSTADDAYASSPSLAIDGTGRVIVTWVEWDSNLASDVYVKRWDGSTWEQLGTGPIDMVAADSANAPEVAVGSDGLPVVVWDESDSHTGSTTRHETFVKRWSGSSWEQLGGGPIAPLAGIQTYGPSIRIDSTDAPVVALYELLSDGSSSRVYVVRLEGNSWTRIGDDLPLGTDEDSTAPYLALDAADEPLVAWNLSTADNNSVRASHWTSSAWVTIGPGALDLDAAETAYGQVAAIDPQGRPIVIWNEWSEANASFDIYVGRCD